MIPKVVFLGSDSMEHRALPIVGIGASAGGVEALQELVRAIPEGVGLAWVVVQHLAPDHPSVMDRLLASQTRLDVRVVTDGMTVEADTVYIAPPGPFTTLSEGRFKLTSHAPETGLRTPIDRFLVSLAEATGREGCAVILSGTGSDGTMGLRAVKSAGGLAIVQQSDSARFPAMPENAAATGMVDFVLRPSEIPPRIADVIAERRAQDQADVDNAMQDAVEERLDALLDLMDGDAAASFRGYKPGTLVRRILRRMTLQDTPDIDAYMALLRDDAAERRALAQDFLIGVTAFFRDPPAFEQLSRRAIDVLVGSGQPSLRIWVPGCSTGEEAYSIAILLSEAMDRFGHEPHVEIFGTDIDGDALRQARSGLYADAALTGIDEARRDRFFTREQNGWQVRSSLRDMCVFAPHNLLSDPPFSRLDLISCRNVMIYLDQAAQDGLLPRFHYALNPGGFLMLGTSEMLGQNERLFHTLDRTARVYRRDDSQSSGYIALSLPRPGGSALPPARPAGRAAHRWAEHGGYSVEAEAEAVYLRDHAGAFAVVDHRNEVIYQSQAMTRFVRPGKGVPSVAIDTYLQQELRLPTQSAIDTVRETGAAAEIRNVIAEVDESAAIFDIQASPVDDGRVMVVLHEVRQRPDSELDLGMAIDADAASLERDLLMSRKRLGALQREYESAEQELRSSNEELLSMNEELQSSNQELETSREELQSINEELETINGELTENNRRLSRANSDLQNLLESTDIATLFLDSARCVRLFTPEATRLFGLQDRDVGRPIDDLAARIDYDQLSADLARVERDLEPVTREVRNAATREVYLARVRPYKSVDDRLDGTVLTFVDITERKRAELQLAEFAETTAQQYAELETLYDTTPVGLGLLDRDHRFLRVNRTLAEINGIEVDDHIGKRGDEITPDAAAYVYRIVEDVFTTGAPNSGVEIRSETPAAPGVEREWIADYYPVKRGETVVAVGACVREVTEQRQLERAAVRNEARLKQIFDASPALIALYEGPDHKVSYCNPLHDQVLKKREIVGKPLCEAMPEFADPEAIEKFNQVLRTGETVETEELTVWLEPPEGGAAKQRYFRQVLVPHLNDADRTVGVMSFAFDITDQVNARREVEYARRDLQTLIDSLAAFVGMLTPDGTLIRANQTALASAELEPEDVLGKKFWDTYWWCWNEETPARLKDAIERAARGETVRYDAQVRVGDGSFMMIDFQLVPVRDEDGKVTRIIPSAIDITQRRAAEEQLHEALARHEAFFENSPVGLAMLDLDRHWIRTNRAFAALFGDSGEEGIVRHPDPVGEIRRTGKPIIGYELRTTTPAFPNEERDLLQDFFPIMVDGEMRALGKSVQDVTEQRAAEERQALLIAELQHRVKNILATVQSVARFTARHSEDKDEMVRSLQSRLSAIARTHDALTREQWSGQWLQALIRNEIMPYDDEDLSRVTITGRDVLLSPAQAMSFGLALHELSTNAAKYGALSDDNGRLHIEIETNRAGKLRRMTWQESDGPPLAPPTRRGFGSFLLEKVLGAELGASVETDYAESGLRVTVSVDDKTGQN